MSGHVVPLRHNRPGFPMHKPAAGAQQWGFFAPEPVPVGININQGDLRGLLGALLSHK